MSLKLKPEREGDTYFQVHDNPKWPDFTCTYCTAPNAVTREAWACDLVMDLTPFCIVLNEDGTFCTGLCYSRYLANVKSSPDRARALRLARLEFEREMFPYGETGTAIGFGEPAFDGPLTAVEIAAMNAVNLDLAAKTRATADAPHPGVEIRPLMTAFVDGKWITDVPASPMSASTPSTESKE